MTAQRSLVARLRLGQTIASIVRRRILFPLGVDHTLRNEDRRVLEQIIFPFLLAQPTLHRYLFVGCESYTHGYNRTFAKREYNTIEPAPERAKYGAERHVVDTMENMGAHYAADSLDVVICNGVIGWGLNDLSAANCAIALVAECLRPRGLLIIGWDDVPEHRPFLLGELQALQSFERYVFPPLGESEYLTQTGLRHTYNFFVKI